MKHIKQIAVAIYAITPLLVNAQLACTMPNGVVITRNIGNCPDDAIKIQAADGTLLPIKPPRIKQAPQPAQQLRTTEKPLQLPPRPAPPVKTAYDYALFICETFEKSDASDCKVNSSVFSTSYIDMTLPGKTPLQASAGCQQLVSVMRQKTKAFSSKEWKVRMFSPFSGNRPIATCTL